MNAIASFLFFSRGKMEKNLLISSSQVATVFAEDSNSPIWKEPGMGL